LLLNDLNIVAPFFIQLKINTISYG